MANLHPGSFIQQSVDAQIVNCTHIKMVECDCNVFGGFELPSATDGTGVAGGSGKQFVFRVVSRNRKSVKIVRLNHYNAGMVQASCSAFSILRSSRGNPVSRDEQATNRSRSDVCVHRLYAPFSM